MHTIRIGSETFSSAGAATDSNVGSATEIGMHLAALLAWIGERDLEVTSWSVEGDRVVIALAGTESPPEVAPLATALAAAFGSPVDLEIQYVALVRDRASGKP